MHVDAFCGRKHAAYPLPFRLHYRCRSLQKIRVGVSGPHISFIRKRTHNCFLAFSAPAMELMGAAATAPCCKGSTCA